MLDEKKYIFQSSAIKDLITKEVEDALNDFYSEVDTLEKNLHNPIIVLYDLKTKVFYIECHINTSIFKIKKDEDATIDPENQEEYRLNRDLQPNNSDFITMKEDASIGRQFSDIVIEYSKEYKEKTPLKVLGGQHRTRAIVDESEKEVIHGFRIYFCLNKENRGEIARVSNTNIAISPDLLDRMDEQQLNPPNKLRNFAQSIGLLKSGQDFGDKKANKDNTPVINMMRTFIVNFYVGKDVKCDIDSAVPKPLICSSGIIDDKYKKIYREVDDFTKDLGLVEAGMKFFELHKKQHDICSKDKSLKKRKEYKNKAMAVAIVASWSFVAGTLQNSNNRLNKLYSLPNNSGTRDPLNSLQMSEFKLKDKDPETYRGLGARSGPQERGRLAKIFLEYSKSEKNIIDKDLLNSAVRYYEADVMREEGDKFKNT